MPSPLYIVAYDICEPARLRKVHRAVKAYATGGQKSAYECFLASSEKRDLLAELEGLIESDEDRIALLRVEERAQPMLLGIATPAVDPEFYYLG